MAAGDEDEDTVIDTTGVDVDDELVTSQPSGSGAGDGLEEQLLPR